MASATRTTLIDLPDEVLARVFGALLRLPPDTGNGFFGARSALGAPHALALACTSRKLWRAFGACLLRIYITSARISAHDIGLLVRASGERLRVLVLGDVLAPELATARGSAALLGAVAETCFALDELRFSATALHIADDGEHHDIVRAFKVIGERITKLTAHNCDADDLKTITAADYHRLQALVLSVDHIYECDAHLATLWTKVSGALTQLELGVSPTTYHNRGRVQHEIVGDGQENLRFLRQLNLHLNRVAFDKLPIRPLVVVHHLLIEPPNDTLRTIVLRGCHVWPLLIAKVADLRSLRDLHIENCLIDATDVAAMVRKAGTRLATFWANKGHWCSPDQLAALRECPRLARVDLYCKYPDAEPDVVRHCQRFGAVVADARVGGQDFTGASLLRVVKRLPNLRRLTVLLVPLDLRTVARLLDAVGGQLHSLTFDTVQPGWHAGDLLDLVRTRAPRIHELSFPAKLREYIPAPPALTPQQKSAHRVQVMGALLDVMEQSMPNLDVDVLRGGLRRFHF